MIRQISLFLLVALALITACQPIQNYRRPDEPMFVGNFAQTPPDFQGELKVITWNIRFARSIEQAIAELSEVEELQNADILLLQEMDEIGVDAIARSLKYNYVYFPASLHTHHDKNFGNAILSLWPISDPAKLLLPYQNPKNRQMRIAVKAVVTVGATEISVYSIHTETAWLSSERRKEQIETLLQDIGEDQPYVIVGGDFNTFTAESIIELEQQFAEFELERVSRGAGYTFERADFGFTLDHIFARVASASATGVWRDTDASDHFPLWVKLSPNWK
jgi:endonuclease/exonuclease/phosphatase family metal-dependent hydrolase